MKLYMIAAVCAVVAGCATTAQRPTVNISSPFDQAQARRMLSDGSNVIKGSAFLRQRGGGIVTCAGSTVTLVPATNYAKERFAYLYGGSLIGGVNRHRVNPVFVPDDPTYQSLIKTTTCDAQGAFEFTGVGEGEFFVTTLVSWQVGYTSQGGHIMKLVQMYRPGQTANVVISGE